MNYFHRTSGEMIKLFTNISLLGLLFWTGCNREERGGFGNAPIAPIAKIGPKSLVGIWTGDHSAFYSSELILDVDSTFTFHDQGCTQKRYSQGKWEIRNGAIWLTSFDRFKPKLEARPVSPKLVIRKKKRRRFREGEMEFVVMRDTMLVVPFGPGDTTHVYFNRLQLAIKRDTIYAIKPNDVFETSKFYRVF